MPPLERYLAVERLELLNGQTGSHLWINWNGKPLGEMGLDKIIRHHSAIHFGDREAFGVHRFRHCIGTAASLVMPQHPGLTTGLLAIGGRVAREHYDMAENVTAAGALHKTLLAQRRSRAHDAERYFRETADYGDATDDPPAED